MRNAGSGPEFIDVAATAAIDFRFEADAVPGRFFLPEVMGGGVGWLDFDRDGRMDLFAVNGRRLVVTPDDLPRSAAAPKRGQALFRQAERGRFVDVALQARSDVEAYGQGIAVGDYDADGFDDLLLTSYGDETLLRNNGEGTFSDVTASAGTTDPDWSTSCAWVDLDSDGLLDLYVANYLDVTPETHRVCDHGGKPGYCGPGSHNGVPDSVYLNRGDGGFDIAPRKLGLAPDPAGKSLGVIAADLDDDLLAEIYVANDMEVNFLFTRDRSSDGLVRYREVAVESGCAVSGDGLFEASMGIACGDLEGDGRPDLYLTHYYRMKNTCYHNLGDLLFEDRSRRSGVAAATHERLGFGTAAVDFDGDGDLDLFAANGHVLGPEQPVFEMLPGLLVNDGRGRFADVGAAAGPYFAEPGLGRGSAAADFDGDGDVDLAVSHLDRPLALLANVSRSRGRFIGLELVSKNRLPPAGGRVRISAGQRAWMIPIVSGGSYLSADDRRLCVGLGEEEGHVTVEVFWPSGGVARHEQLEADRYWRIYEAERPPESRRVQADEP